MHLQRPKEAGQVLVNVLIVGGLVTLMLTGYMVMAGRQHYLTLRSQTWAAEIPIAEAGIEEALAHMNRQPLHLVSHGWTLQGRELVKSRTFGDGYYYTSISTTEPPSIVSIGYARPPGQTNYSHRTVMVTTRGGFPGYAILARDFVNMSGGPIIDSFNSTDPNSSTLGRYDPLKRRDHATVGSLSSAQPAITTGGGYIYGSVATGPGGTVTGTIGDIAWTSSHPGQVQPGHFRDDLNTDMPDITAPFTTAAGQPLMPGIVGGTNYTFVLNTGDYYKDIIKMQNSDRMLVQGHARLLVTGTFDCSGDILIAPAGSLKIYIGGPTADIGGNGVINGTQQASKCAIYGLPTLVDFTYRGNSEYIGTLYAPQAALKISGTPDVYGAIVARSFTCNGNMGIHYDEALGGPSGAAYRIMSWEEL